MVDAGFQLANKSLIHHVTLTLLEVSIPTDIFNTFDTATREAITTALEDRAIKAINDSGIWRYVIETRK